MWLAPLSDFLAFTPLSGSGFLLTPIRIHATRGIKILPSLSSNFYTFIYSLGTNTCKIHATEHVLVRSANARHSAAFIRTKTQQTKTSTRAASMEIEQATTSEKS